MIPAHATLADISAAVNAFPGVLESEIHEDYNTHSLRVDLKLVDRTFDLDTFKHAMRDHLSVAIRFEVTVSGQAHPDKPNPFIRVEWKDYDPDMTDAELRLRLITERG